VPREAWTGPQDLAEARNTAITLLSMAGFRNIKAATEEMACDQRRAIGLFLFRRIERAWPADEDC
jgi:hypothetical protein